MTRILVCANNIDELGGAQQVVHMLAGAFHELRHEVTAVGITPYEPIHSFPGEYPRRVLMSQVWPKKSTHTERVRANLRREAVSAMAELLREGPDEPSIVITAQVWAMEILTDALAAVTPRVRSRWSVIGQYHGSFAAAASGRDLGRILRSYGPVSVFTALTHEDRQAFIAAGLNNVVVMGNPLALWPERPRMELERDRKTLLYLGRLSAEKGVDLLLDAWSLVADEHPDWRLRITGDGPNKEQLRHQAAGLAGAERIEWSNATKDPYSTLMDADLVVLASRTEGLPLVLAEAQACGVPVVATDCSSGVRQLVGDWGVLVPREDSRALASALDRAMSDGEWRVAAGERGREEMQRYRREAIIGQWQKLLGDVLR